MIAVALVTNPLIVWLKTRKNPYPLVFTALRESGTVAFFTRSSAANIPVNLSLCDPPAVRPHPEAAHTTTRPTTEQSASA